MYNSTNLNYYYNSISISELIPTVLNFKSRSSVSPSELLSLWNCFKSMSSDVSCSKVDLNKAGLLNQQQCCENYTQFHLQ